MRRHPLGQDINLTLSALLVVAGHTNFWSCGDIYCKDGYKIQNTKYKLEAPVFFRRRDVWPTRSRSFCSLFFFICVGILFFILETCISFFPTIRNKKTGPASLSNGCENWKVISFFKRRRLIIDADILLGIGFYQTRTFSFPLYISARPLSLTLHLS